MIRFVKRILLSEVASINFEISVCTKSETNVFKFYFWGTNIIDLCLHTSEAYLHINLKVHDTNAARLCVI